MSPKNMKLTTGDVIKQWSTGHIGIVYWSPLGQVLAATLHDPYSGQRLGSQQLSIIEGNDWTSMVDSDGRELQFLRDLVDEKTEK